MKTSLTLDLEKKRYTPIGKNKAPLLLKKSRCLMTPASWIL